MFIFSVDFEFRIAHFFEVDKLMILKQRSTLVLEYIIAWQMQLNPKFTLVILSSISGV